MASYEKIVVITRKTRLAELVERFNTRGQAKFYIEHAGGDFKDYESEDDAYRRSLDRVRRGVEVGLKTQLMDRGLAPTTAFGAEDVVVALGQDGLVANCAKYAAGQPLVGVNPDPGRFDGILLPFRPEQAREAVQGILEGRSRQRPVALAEALLNDGQRLLAFNDLFIGAKTHVSARYVLKAGGRSEQQSSSGIIVSTGAGSTGWLSSVFNMASGVTRFAGGRPGAGVKWDWEERRLAFVVREPFVSRRSGAEISAGYVADGGEIVVESLMPAGGVVFSDGVEADFLNFNAGSTLRVRVAERQALLVVPS